MQKMMQGKIKSLLLISFMLLSMAGQSQVLITLIFGDKLNSDGLEFGLTGGLVGSNFQKLENNKFLFNANLGFYFDIKLNEHWWINTGVAVINKRGANRLTGDELAYFYDVDSISIDPAMHGGYYGQLINYFDVPILLKYRFRNYFFAEAGFMVALRTTASTTYTFEENGSMLNFSVDNSDYFTRLDGGLMAGMGYKMMQGTGVNIGVRYYYGLVDVHTSDHVKIYNQSFYLFVDIPIGAGDKPDSESKK